jgi:6-oxo-cyclohex-1-ene-carbonyl-CoA hydrolase
MKLPNRHWLAANMNHEAWLGFNAFDAKKPTGKDVIDFIKFRQLVAEGALFDDKFAEQVMAKPKA